LPSHESSAALSIPDRRARVQQALEAYRLHEIPSAKTAANAWEEERFADRVKALFYARLMFLALGLSILAVSPWSDYFGLHGTTPFVGYFVMLFYSVANYLVMGHPKASRVVTYLTLCLDLCIMVVLIARPSIGGLSSPLLATQVLFTVLFALLFPKPLAIVPPLLALPITTRLDQVLDRQSPLQLLTVLWYSAINCILVYVIIYMHQREEANHRQVLDLQGDLKELAVVEERNRLARDIHDGIGASLSALIIQSEYLMQLANEPKLRAEIAELKSSAEDSIEELRRSLRMMREDFELSMGLEEYVRTFSERTQLPTAFERTGAVQKLPYDAQVTLFRVLQECLSNAAKHAHATKVSVKLSYQPQRVMLSVRDDGRGFELKTSPPGHYGLRNMQERAAKVQGDLVIDSSPSAGTHVLLSLPGGGA
jgi:signal transduction histidine kinase